MEMVISDTLEAASHASTKLSHTSSALARERAKVAELMIEQEGHLAKLELQRKKHEIEAEEEKLQLQIAIGKAKAKECIYAEAEQNAEQRVDGSSSLQKMQQREPTTLNDSPNDAPTPSSPQPTSLNPAAPTFHPIEHLHRQNEQLLHAHYKLATSISLPQPEVQKFTGDVMNFNSFIMAFDTRIASHSITDADRLYYLDQHLTGEPKQLISGCMYMNPNDGYHEARQLLQTEYGDPFKVSVAYVNNVLSWPNIKADDGHALKDFSILLKRCLLAMDRISNMSELNNLSNMQAIVLKLPFYLQNKWREYASDQRHSKRRIVTFNDLVHFVSSAADSANDPVFGKDVLSRCGIHTNAGAYKKDRTASKPKSSSFTTHMDSKAAVKPLKSQNIVPAGNLKCPYCAKSHDLDKCDAFCKQTMNKRREFLISNHMCFGCFAYNHTVKGCLQRRSCDKCKKRHPASLHVDDFKPAKSINKQETIKTT